MHSIVFMALNGILSSRYTILLLLLLLLYLHTRLVVMMDVILLCIVFVTLVMGTIAGDTT